MIATKFSKRNKCLFLGLLALLNIVIRVPSIPHERGSPDEFTMHILANSLDAFGHANWWVHPSSVFGFYPYSYASSAPFIYSEILQCTDLGMESVAGIFCALLGIFVMFSAYVVAGAIKKNNDLFKFLVAFVVSLSPGVLTYLTWQVSARGFFIALLPFFIYVLLKTHTSTVRFGALTATLFVLLMATHHYYILTVPIAFSFIVISIFYKFKTRVTKFIRLSDPLTSILLLAGIVGMFSIPFFTGLFIDDSKYDAPLYIIEQSIRYSGPFFVFALTGLTYLVFKRDREFGEWFIVLTALLWAPFMWISIYAHYFASILLGILMCVAIANIARTYNPDRKQIFSVVIIILLLFISFSGFYQHWRPNIERSQRACQWYMEDSTYNCALWVRDSIDENKRMIGGPDNQHTPSRIFAISEVPVLVMPETDITYGFVNGSGLTIVANSPLTTNCYMDNPYVLPTYPETVSDRWYLGCVDVDSGVAKEIIKKYKLSYYIEDMYFQGVFTASLRKDEKNHAPVYDNGIIHIWYLNEW